MSSAANVATGTVKRRSAVGFGLLLGAVLGAMGLMLAIDQPLAAMAVPWAAALAWLVLYRLPLKVSVIGLLLLAALCEGLEWPLALGWEAPFHPLAKALLVNASALTGLAFLRAPVIDLLTVGLWVVALVRSRRATGEAGWQSQTPGVRVLEVMLLVSAGTVLLLDGIGAVRGGNMSEGLWQLRHLLLFPVRCALLLRALDGTVRELKVVGALLVAVGVVKALIGIWFLYRVVYAQGRDVEFTTSHTDTLLFVPLLAMFFAQLVERFSWRHLWRSLPWVAIVAFGMVCNDRRLAYVCLAFSGLATLALTPNTRFKRAMVQVAACVAPIMPFYLLAGWTSQGGKLFWLARLVRSVVQGDPNQGNQADYRDLENLDVLFTWSNNKLLPYGFGHKMQQIFPLPDISPWFPAWEYHPHNQYLWLLTIAGPVGFTLMMMPQVVTAFLCARVYRASGDKTVRVAMLTGVGIVISFFCQVWGDMGTLSWTVTWMAALAAAFAAKLAWRTRALAEEPKVEELPFAFPARDGGQQQLPRLDAGRALPQ
ncbi:MAG: hypothetical protein IPJ65_34710 [Archangiaceae bacterium]|nr:hypothetical protein [Archangiaceae bacterium]